LTLVYYLVSCLYFTPYVVDPTSSSRFHHRHPLLFFTGRLPGRGLQRNRLPGSPLPYPVPHLHARSSAYRTTNNTALSRAVVSALAHAHEQTVDGAYRRTYALPLADPFGSALAGPNRWAHALPVGCADPCTVGSAFITAVPAAQRIANSVADDLAQPLAYHSAHDDADSTADGAPVPRTFSLTHQGAYADAYHWPYAFPVASAHAGSFPRALECPKCNAVVHAVLAPHS